jgi:hypothetical protein
MRNNFLRYYKPQALIILVVILGIALFLGKQHWGIPLSLFSIITILLVAIDKWLWKYKPFSYLFWVTNFSGRYEGKLEYYFTNESGERIKRKLDHIKVIHQTASSVIIHSFTKKNSGRPSSFSKSIDVFVRKEDDDSYSLIYTYLNNGSSEQQLAPFYGTETIKVIKKGNETILSGHYYTDRQPVQTRGRFINLKYTSDELHHEF